MTASDFNQVVVRHEVFLKPYAVSLTHNTEDANDLFQETMLRALINREKYQFGTNIKAWLYTIMRNIFINNYRRSKKFSKTDTDAASDTYLYNARLVNYNDGWENVRMAEIRSAIDDLPQVFRVSFELHYTGYKYQEIAELLEQPLGTVKSRIHFARKILVTQLER
jgi:RNA polymerase sigma factor (sigma-70 family)